MPRKLSRDELAESEVPTSRGAAFDRPRLLLLIRNRIELPHLILAPPSSEPGDNAELVVQDTALDSVMGDELVICLQGAVPVCVRRAVIDDDHAAR